MYLRLNVSRKSNTLNLVNVTFLESWTFPLIKWGGWNEFLKVSKKKGVCKIGRVVVKRGVSIIFILTNPFQCYISLSVWCVCVCVFCLFTPFVSVLFMFHIVFLHLINRYIWLLLGNDFWKEKAFGKVNVWYQWIIHLII